MSDSPQNATPKRRPRWAKAFLSVLAESGNIRLSCQAAAVDRSTAYRLRSSDETFLAEWEQAQEEAADLLEQEARRRAHDGWDEPVFGSMGQGLGSGEIGAVRKYSDTLLIFLLKGARPEKYRERHEVMGKDGAPLFKVYVGIDTDNV